MRSKAGWHLAMDDNVTLYMPLLEEGVPCFRPVRAERLGGGEFRITGPIPSDEVWRFKPGSVVRGVVRRLSDGEVLVAEELERRT